MPARFSTNAKQVAGNFRRMGERVNPFQLAANVEIAQDLTTQTQESFMEDVYRVPIRRSASGKPLWKRTLTLYTGEKWVVQGQSVVHTNASGHYIFRYRLGRSNGRKLGEGTRMLRGAPYVLAKNLRAIVKKRSEALRRSIRV